MKGGWNKYGNSNSGNNSVCITHDEEDVMIYDFSNKWFENVDGLDYGKDRQEKQNNESKMHIGKFCNNCGKYGHLFSNCVVPITSIGIIACRKKTNGLGLDQELDYFEKYGVIDATVSNKIQTATDCRDCGNVDGNVELSNMTNIKTVNSYNEFEYLMIQRVDSFGYIEFMRGKYSIHNYQFLKNIIDEMTVQEKHNILTKPFDELWVSLWGEYSGLQYRGEKQISKNK